LSSGGDHIDSKIADEGLRRMVREGTGDANVIVELDVPQQQVTIDRDAFASSPWAGVSLDQPSAEDGAEAEDVKSRGRAFLEEVSEAPPVPLADRGSFAVRVKGDTLGTICRSPLVRAIHLSQLRR
jgi:hypothetical protein